MEFKESSFLIYEGYGLEATSGELWFEAPTTYKAKKNEQKFILNRRGICKSQPNDLQSQRFQIAIAGWI